MSLPAKVVKVLRAAINGSVLIVRGFLFITFTVGAFAAGRGGRMPCGIAPTRPQHATCVPPRGRPALHISKMSEEYQGQREPQGQGRRLVPRGLGPLEPPERPRVPREKGRLRREHEQHERRRHSEIGIQAE